MHNFETFQIFSEKPGCNCNKTGLQPVSRPVEQIIGFFPKDLKRCKKQCKLFPGFWGQVAHFWGQKSKNLSLEKKLPKDQWRGKFFQIFQKF